MLSYPSSLSRLTISEVDDSEKKYCCNLMKHVITSVIIAIDFNDSGITFCQRLLWQISINKVNRFHALPLQKSFPQYGKF